jgi:hypothetical protein
MPHFLAMASVPSIVFFDKRVYNDVPASLKNLQILKAKKPSAFLYFLYRYFTGYPCAFEILILL